MYECSFIKYFYRVQIQYNTNINVKLNLLLLVRKYEISEMLDIPLSVSAQPECRDVSIAKILKKVRDTD